MACGRTTIIARTPRTCPGKDASPARPGRRAWPLSERRPRGLRISQARNLHGLERAGLFRHRARRARNGSNIPADAAGPAPAVASLARRHRAGLHRGERQLASRQHGGHLRNGELVDVRFCLVEGPRPSPSAAKVARHTCQRGIDRGRAGAVNAQRRFDPDLTGSVDHELPPRLSRRQFRRRPQARRSWRASSSISTRKDAPFRFIDTHAGAGRYDLRERRGEALAGMARGRRRAWSTPRRPRRSPRSSALSRGRRPARRRGPAGAPTRARRRSRKRSCAPQDRIALCEAHPEEREALVAGARPRRAAQHRRHGRLCRAQRLSAAQGAARRRPDRPAVRGARRSRSASSRRSRARCANGRPEPTSPGGRSASPEPTPASSMRSPRSARPTSCGSNSTSARARSARRARSRSTRAGLLVVNPPHTLIDEARALMPWLAQTLGRDGREVCAWLTDR